MPLSSRFSFNALSSEALNPVTVMVSFVAAPLDAAESAAGAWTCCAEAFVPSANTAAAMGVSRKPLAFHVALLLIGVAFGRAGKTFSKSNDASRPCQQMHGKKGGKGRRKTFTARGNS
jgi:hypothetical protein